MAEFDPSPDFPAEASATETETPPIQVPYRPHSQAPSIQTVCPPTMATPMSVSLDRVEAVTGQSIDSFVAERLGIDQTTLFDRFAAEQIDCLGITYLNLDRGRPTLIGNDTGTGKGRIVSGVLAPVLADDAKITVFITAKPDLYVDMLARDMVDTGVDSLVHPFFTNSGLNLELTAPDGEVLGILETPAPKQHQADTRALIETFKETGSLGEYNCIFTTYDQLAQKGSIRRQLLETVAPRAVFVLDECDLGGGASGPTPPMTEREMAQSAAGKDLRSVSTFLTKSVLPHSDAYVLLSATAFKDPYVMTRLLYPKSEIRETGLDAEALAERLVEQGIPGQQDFTNKLALSGELVRLEKSMEGITFQTEAVPVNLEAVDAASRIVAKIVQFDRAKQDSVEVLKDIHAGSGEAVQASDGSDGVAGVDSTNFTSTAFNFQQQFLFFLKADAIAQRTIESIEAGRKPGIIFFNTMQSAIETHLDNKRADIEQEVLIQLQAEFGDQPVPEEQVQEIAKERYRAWLRSDPAPEMTLSVGDLLERQLDRSRMVTIKDAYGERTRHYLTDEELSQEAVALDNEIRLLCRNTDWSDIKISGVDAVLQQVEAAGYSIAEMSGRSLGIDYSGDVPRFQEVKASQRDVRAAAKNGFNNGDQDALITNITTGWSGHASRSVDDQRQRETILAQPHPDGNKLVQSLGRFNRVGQVNPAQHAPDWTDEQGNPGWGEVRDKYGIPPTFGLPVMTMVYAEGDAYEERITANINRKMASLNANTTGSRSSAVHLGEVDFLNSYGDQVAWDLMNDDPELHEKLDFPLGEFGPTSEKRQGAMAKVTGRSLLLPLDERRQLFDTLKENFEEYIAQREAIGESPMEAKTLDLRAKTIGRIEIAPAKSDSLFAGATYVEVVQARSLSKPLTEEAVANRVRKTVGLDTVKTLDSNEFEPDGEARRLGVAAMESQVSAVLHQVEERMRSLDHQIEFKKQRYDKQLPPIQTRLEELHNQIQPLQEQQVQLLQQQEQEYRQRLGEIPETDSEARAKVKPPRPDRAIEEAIKTLEKAIKTETKAKQKLENDTNPYEERRQKDLLEKAWKATKERLELCPVGQPVRLYVKDLGAIYGIVTDVRRVEGIKNPLAGGAWKVKFALADGAREMTLKLSDINFSNKVQIDQAETAIQYKPPFSRVPVHQMFSELQQERFETRQIVTGNLLASPVGKKYISFTNNQEQVRQGLLLPRSYDIEEALQKMPVVLKTREQQEEFLTRTAGSGAKMQTVDDALRFQHTTRLVAARPTPGLLLEVPAAKKGGGKYFKDPDLMALLDNGEFEKRGKGMQGFVPGDRMDQFLDLLHQKFAGQIAVTDEFYKGIARDMTGSEVQVMEWFKEDQPLDLAAQELEFSTEGIAARIAEQKALSQQKRQQQALESGDLDAAKPAGEAQKQKVPQHSDLEILVQAFEGHFSAGGRFDRITEARKVAIATLQQAGSDLDLTLTNKQVDECIEKSLVRVARTLTQSLEPLTCFDTLVDLYDRQPYLSSRTSSSILLQQYSTPMPLGRLAQQLGDIHSETTVYEPTAGNGSLLTTASPARAIVNEIDSRRASELQTQGFAVTLHDAAEFAPPRQSVDRVILNPPFGAVSDPTTGQSKRWMIDLENPAPGTRPYETTAIDHAITFKSLSALKDDGKAVVILGAPMEQKMGHDASGAYNEGQTRSFFFTLYNNYKVTQHFTVTGDNLYDKQGTTFPVDVIVIDGRGKSELPLPAVTPPPAYRTWEELRGIMAAAIDLPELSAVNSDLSEPDAQLNLSSKNETASDEQSQPFGESFTELFDEAQRIFERSENVPGTARAVDFGQSRSEQDRIISSSDPLTEVEFQTPVSDEARMPAVETTQVQSIRETDSVETQTDSVITLEPSPKPPTTAQDSEIEGFSDPAPSTSESIQTPPDLQEQATEALRILPASDQTGQAEKNIAKLLDQAGLTAAVVEGDLNQTDFYLRVENEPYLPLVIERLLDRLYLTHYRESNGDLIHDGEMVFQVQPTDDGFKLHFLETAVQNPFSGGESRLPDRSFATVFSRNLVHQEFGPAALEAYIQQRSEQQAHLDAGAVAAVEPLPSPESTPGAEIQQASHNPLVGSSEDLPPQPLPLATNALTATDPQLIPEQTARILNITQQVMEHHDPQTVNALRQADDEGWSPSLQQLRQCFMAAQSLGRDTNEITQIAQQVIAGTEEAHKPKAERDPNFVNPDVRIKGDTLERMKSHIADARAQLVIGNCHQILKDLGKPQSGNSNFIKAAKSEGDLVITFDRETETLTAFSRKQNRILLTAVAGVVQEGQPEDMKFLKQKTTKFLEYTQQAQQQMA